MPAKRPRVLQTFNRETDEIVVQPHDAVAGLRGNDYFPGPRGSGLHHLGEDYVIQVRRYLCRACRRTVSLYRSSYCHICVSRWRGSRRF